MHTRYRAVGVLALALGVGCGASDDTDGEMTSAGGKADEFEDEDALAVVTATQVEALDEDVSSIDPPVDAFSTADTFAPGVYLRPMSALGYYGPLGPFGPLGTLGPVGEATWSPSTFVDIAGPWSAFADQLADNDGPLSADGPLGRGGPVDRDAWFDTTAAIPGVTKAFVQQLEPGGVFVPLGPIGPLGALGPLGPLGPVGAHGYVATDDGAWIPGDDVDECVHSGERGVCRVARVPFSDDEVRTWELFEHYSESFAQAMPDNDTSFMVTGAADVGETDTYAFTSAQTQVVTVVVLPQWTLYDPATSMGLLGQAALLEYELPSFVPNFVFPFNVYDHDASFDDFDVTLTIETEDGTVRQAVSDSAMMVDWISIEVPAGAELSATISLASRWSAPWRVFGPEYRLYVVGSTPHFSGRQVSGDHVRAAETAN